MATGTNLGDEDSEEDSGADFVDEVTKDTENVDARHTDKRFNGQKFVFDFESGFDSHRYHYLNMVAMMCLEGPNFLLVSRGWHCPNLLLQWIFADKRNCTFLSHNGRCYGNYFILRALQTQGHYPTKMHDGTHLTMLTLAGVQARSVDTLFFMPRSLAELPFALGIGSFVKKGFFPIYL